MRLGLSLSLLVHGAAAVALALLGIKAAHPAPERPLSVSFRAEAMDEIEPPREDPALTEPPPVQDRLELPEEAPVFQEIEAPREIRLDTGDLPRPVRLAQPLRPRAAPAPVVVAAPPAPGKLEPPRLLEDISPTARYPERARRRGMEGEVLLLVRVGMDGSVADVKVATSSGHEELDRAAVDAAKLWRFEPARRDGKAVTYDVRIPVEFRLTDA